jgi:integrase
MLLRPAQVGVGRLVLAKSRPGPGKLYTDSGETHDDKGLKRRPAGDKRVVPIPPELVRILVEHLEEFGVAEDGRLFRTSTGGTVSASAAWRIWRDARLVGLSPDQEVTPLAGRPYDLRHACATLLLNAGVPPKEVARRLGHSVEVCGRPYAGCLDGDEERINRMIERALAA